MPHRASRVFGTLVAVAGFVLLYEATTHDSRFAAQYAEDEAAPGDRVIPGQRMTFTATAYCKGTTTASGVQPRSGVAASDPDILPVGSVIRIDSRHEQHTGIYTIMDTGPKVQGRKIDIYIWSCIEALEFGRQPIGVIVLRLGWSPNATPERLIDRLLGRMGRIRPQPPLLPSRPLSLGDVTAPKEPQP